MLPLLVASLISAQPIAEERSILFVGNSFTYGADSPVMNYKAGSVSDLNGESKGGVPALFKSFSDRLGLGWQVGHETSPGATLEWHWRNRLELLDRNWDAVVMQDYSTLDPDRPGDPAKTINYSGRLASLFRQHNPSVQLSLTATWSRPNLIYPRGQRWSGQPIEQMAIDIRQGYDRARGANKAIARVHPVGQAFSCAIARGIADRNPYDGIDPGRIALWAADHYHGSTPGYYLEALVVFAGVTGVDPRRLGPDERAARDLGIKPQLARRLQRIAYDMALGQGCDGNSRPTPPRRGRSSSPAQPATGVR